MTSYAVSPVTGLGEVHAGDDLAALLANAADLQEGDILVVTSKVVSKAEGRVVSNPKDDVVAAETARVVARRGPTTIARHHLGLVMAAAGVDTSNTDPGSVVLLPRDPDASAQALRTRLQELTGRNVAVLVSDTFGRAWRTGQTDVAVGAAGIEPLDDHSGRVDAYGNPLLVTAPAVADQVTGAAELAQGKTTGVPAAVVRGLSARVLPAGRHGPGARALIRPEAEDMFGLGSREAVIAALGDAGSVLPGFGAPAPATSLLDALATLGFAGEVVGDEIRVPLRGEPRAAGRNEARLEALLRAHGWVRADTTPDLWDPTMFRATTP